MNRLFNLCDSADALNVTRERRQVSKKSQFSRDFIEKCLISLLQAAQSIGLMK
jgi:hypothetical protein